MSEGTGDLICLLFALLSLTLVLRCIRAVVLSTESMMMNGFQPER